MTVFVVRLFLFVYLVRVTSSTWGIIVRWSLFPCLLPCQVPHVSECAGSSLEDRELSRDIPGLRTRAARAGPWAARAGGEATCGDFRGEIMDEGNASNSCFDGGNPSTLV
ncbi:hypothetical protein CsSME_00025392 [Camellia sinensis var. sinensis]